MRWVQSNSLLLREITVNNCDTSMKKETQPNVGLVANIEARNKDYLDFQNLRHIHPLRMKTVLLPGFQLVLEED
jgi:hypothetical protein